MSAFVLIVPDGWTELTGLEPLGAPGGYTSMIDNQDWVQFTLALYDHQIIPETLRVIDARYFIDAGDQIRLLVITEPV